MVNFIFLLILAFLSVILLKPKRGKIWIPAVFIPLTGLILIMIVAAIKAYDSPYVTVAYAALREMITSVLKVLISGILIFILCRIKLKYNNPKILLIISSILITALIFVGAYFISLKRENNKFIREYFQRNSPISNSVTDLYGSSINDIIGKYDPLLSYSQTKYRLWIDNETAKMADADLFGRQSVKNISLINANINYFRNSIDTIKAYMLDQLSIATEYGSELAEKIRDDDKKKEFQVKWRLYQEGVAEVMNYDIEGCNQLIEALNFLKNNQSKCYIEDDLLVFVDDASLSEYQRLMEIITDNSILDESQKVRSKTVQVFLEAINIARQEND